MSEKTYGNLKKRIFDLLFEYSSSSDTVYVADGDKELIAMRIPDVVSSSLIRMYESLPMGINKAAQRLCRHNVIFSHPSIWDKKSGFEFELSGTHTGVFFRFFGGGNVVFSDAGGNTVEVIECRDSKSLSDFRHFVESDYKGICRVSADGDICIKDFAVYEVDSVADINGLCAVNERSFCLPEDFDKLICVSDSFGEIGKDRLCVSEGCVFLDADACGKDGFLEIEYKKKPIDVTCETPDNFVFHITALEFEALICLAASELCRNENADLYTGLVYKYNDLCEGIRGGYDKKVCRNTFFSAKTKRRW